MPSQYVVVTCLAVAGVALIGGAIAYGMMSPSSTNSAGSPKKIEPISEYVGSIAFNIQPGSIPTAGAKLEFTAATYLDRLRVFVEFSNSRRTGLEPADWAPSRKLLLADLRDVPKGGQKRITMIYESHNAGQKPQFWWGDPNSPQEYSTLLERAKSKARIVFVGPDNKEQTYKIIVIRTTYDMAAVELEGAPSLIILDEKEITSSLNWPKD